MAGIGIMVMKKNGDIHKPCLNPHKKGKRRHKNKFKNYPLTQKISMVDQFSLCERRRGTNKLNALLSPEVTIVRKR